MDEENQSNKNKTVCFWSEQSRCVYSTFLMSLAMAGFFIAFYCIISSSKNLADSPLKFHSTLVKEFRIVAEIARTKNKTKSQKKHEKIRAKYFKDEDAENDAVDEITQTKTTLVLSIVTAPVRIFFYFASLLLAFKLSSERKRKQYLIFIKLWILGAIIFVIFDSCLIIWYGVSQNDNDTFTCFNEGLKNLMSKFNKSKKSRSKLNRIHSKFKCCGFKNFNDWSSIGNNTDKEDFFTIPLSCCNPDNSKKCNFDRVPVNRKTFSWVGAIHKDGCTEPLINNLRGSIKLVILLTGLLSIFINAVQSIVYRYFWTNLESLDESDENFDEKLLTPAFLISYNPNSGNTSDITSKNTENQSSMMDQLQGMGFGGKKSKMKGKIKPKAANMKKIKVAGKGGKFSKFLKKAKK